MARQARILATGFNAHGQLDPSSKPNNIHTFKHIGSVEDFKPEADLAIKSALWSSTVLMGDNHKLLHLGMSGEYCHDEVDMTDVPTAAKFFGDISGIRGYIHPCSPNLYLLQQNGTFQASTIPLPLPDFPIPDWCIYTTNSRNFAIAGNGKICHDTCGWDPQGNERASIGLFTNWKAFLEDHPQDEFRLEPISSLVATATTFSALTGSEKVFTFGDPRYPSLLGRTPSEESPASQPEIVSALDGIPILKLVAGTWIVAALSQEKDLYIWGHVLIPRMSSLQDETGLSTLLANADGENEEVHLLDVDGGKDIEDVAVGDEHIVVLTTDGELWGLGSNEYGQLGLGKEVKGTRGKWVKIEVGGEGEKVVEMKAGPLNTFLVVADGDVP
ncbi:MAG: hypothetical protein Q9170_002114 [Blastenia crenularia]